MPIPLILLAIAEMATLRALVQAVVSGLAFSIGASAIESLFDTIVSKIRINTGETEDSAWVTLGEYILSIIGGSLALFLALRGRLPVRVSDRLGLVLKKKPQAIIKPPVEEVAKLGAEFTGRSASVVMTGLKIISAFVGTSSLALLAVAQWIDFGNWNSGAYQGTFNKLFATFGRVPDASFSKSTQVSADMWKKIYQFYQVRGAVGITDPTGDSDYPFNAENLAMIVDKVAIAMTAEGEKVTYKNVLALTQAMITYKNGNPVEPVTLPSPSSSGTSSTPSTSSAPVTQIFTGVVKNGVLGAPTPFESVGDGYITSNDDLMETASQTLANFILTLPAKFNYEIAIVNTFRSPGGFSLKGEAVRIVSSYNKDGSPRYKTIYKKFAVLHVWLVDMNGRKITILKENMGQVNATDYTPTPAQLAQVSASITPSIFTTNVENITGIVSNSPVTVASPTQPPAQGSSSTSSPPAPTPAPVATPSTYVAPPAPAPAIVSSGGVVAQIQNAPISYPLKTNTGASNLNVRSAPGTNSTIIDRLPNGTPVRNPEGAGYVDGYAWYRIVYDTASGSKSGYVATEFLIKN